MISEILLLVEQIRPRTTQIDNLGAPIAILFQPCTFEAVEGVRDTLLQQLVRSPGKQMKRDLTYLAAAHDTFVLVVAEGAFVADSYESGWTDVGVAYWAFAVAFVAETADGDA